MYIDRMREAQAEEQQQTATVAEQVFSPQPAPQSMPQMQLAQQGLGGAPVTAPAPKMPTGVNMGMPRSMGATPQAVQMQAMQQKMAPRPSVAGMNQLPMGPGMIPRAASGGLLAFAGGGEIQGYADGELVQNDADTEATRAAMREALKNPENYDPFLIEMAREELRDELNGEQRNLSDALVPIINPADEASINASVLDPRYGLKNSDELSPRDTTREMLRSEELSKLNREIEEQREIVARRGGGFDDGADLLGGTPGAGEQARLNKLIAKLNALT
jgi:hypothetical protein